MCKEDYTLEQLNVWASGAHDKKRWMDKLSKDYFLVAFFSEKIIGFGSLENSDYLDLIYVHKDFQRRGIATILYAALEKEAKQREATSLHGDVSKTAKGFFEKKGFTVVTEQTKIIAAVEIRNYKMTKKL